MGLINLVINFLIILLLIRLFIRPNEAFFNPIYSLVYRLTDPILTPSRYLTKTPFQGILLTLILLIALRGLLYPTLMEENAAVGIGQSFLEFFDLLLKVYMVILLVSIIGKFHQGSLVTQMAVRAFLPIYNIAARVGVGPAKFNLASFFVIIIAHVFLSLLASLLISPQDFQGPIILIKLLARSLIMIVSLANFFTFVIIAGALMSWVSPDPRNPIVQAIHSISEPILTPFRRFVPTLGGLDISPIFAIIAMQLIGSYGELLIKQIAGAIIQGLA
jgi:YggT family protein